MHVRNVITALAAMLLFQPPGAQMSAAYWEEQAALLEAGGDMQGAESALRKSLALAKSDLDRAVALSNLTGFLVGLGRMGEAGRLVPQLAVTLDRGPADSHAVASAMNGLGSFFQQEGKPERAVPWLERALASASRLRAPVETRVAIANNLSAALLDMGKPNDGVQLLEQTPAESEISPAKSCLTRANLAAALTVAGNHDQARRTLAQALLQAESLDLSLEEHLQLHDLGALLLRRLGDKKQAGVHKREAAKLASELADRSGSRHRVDITDLRRR